MTRPKSVVKTVYFVRHGQSMDNASPVFQAPDSPLSELGLKQAAKIAERAKHLEFQALIASPFMRAKQTAEAIAKETSKTPEFSDLFTERIKPTSIDGKPYTDKQANATWRSWEETLITAGTKVEDGENYDEIVARAQQALDYLKNRPEDSILVVTHGFFLNTMLALVLLKDTLSPETIQQIYRAGGVENTSLTAFLLQERFEDPADWRLWIYNDHSHLAD